ncbi:uncharacterized protein [Eurosta solidaginis]|uniref:uncharacterized protein n=1 Tax=Eurosta solidaginis TaxID=178769 RepID=UPI0035307449
MYSLIYLAILFVILSCHLSHTKAQFRMTNSEIIDITERPHAVAIYGNSYYMCDGSLVTLKSVVTVASCVSEMQKSELEVLGGVTDRMNRDSRNAQTRKVEENICADGYTRESECMNIAVLKLEGHFKHTKTVYPVKLCGSDLKTGDLMQVIGWVGCLLQSTILYVKRKDECQHLLVNSKKSLAATAVCATFGGENRGYGLSGAGAIVGNKLCAVSYNNINDWTIPGVFTDLTHQNIKTFLDNNINFDDAITTLSFIILENERNGEEALHRKILRDHSNPLDVPESAFVSSYRVSKEAFIMLLNIAAPHIKHTSLPTTLQMAATLRFLAEGGFQKAVGKDSYIAMGRSTVSKVLKEVLRILEKYLCPRWIKLRMTESELTQSKQYFQQHFGIPGVIGCIDGTHIQITKPNKDHSIFYNRKGYFSMNAMIICDYNMVIRSVDGRHPGSSHDALIWSVSKANDSFQRRYENRERGSWLLGDAGYPLQPFLLTPFRNPQAYTAEHTFNQKHCSGRNIVERTIGVLKSRFRCLARTLQYQPEKVIQIINVCCALHNICIHYKVQEIVDVDIENQEDALAEEIFNDSILYDEAALIRENKTSHLHRNS